MADFLNLPGHFLVIEEGWNHDYDVPLWEIQHPEGCADKLDQCWINHEIDEAGIDAFDHTYTNGLLDTWPKHLPTKPGRYPIKAWSDQYYVWDYGAYEYDGGLEIIE